MNRSIVHNFNESLELSQKLNYESDWIAFYKRIWPDAVSIVRVDKHSNIQTRGIDRMVWLPSDKQILIDEKCRDHWYGDILLEVTSVGNWIDGQYIEKKIGWALDDAKHCDFVAYAIPKVKKCFLLPFELTKAALRFNLSEWKQKRGKFPIDSENDGYVTRNVGVDWDDLKVAINQQIHRQFGSALALPKSTDNELQMDFDWD